MIMIRGVQIGRQLVMIMIRGVQIGRILVMTMFEGSDRVLTCYDHVSEGNQIGRQLVMIMYLRAFTLGANLL